MAYTHLQMDDRDRDEDDALSSYVNESTGNISGQAPSISTNSSENTSAHHSIDILFGNPQDMLTWEPVKPPPALGELLDSRYMLPLLFPSDPRMLTALPDKMAHIKDVIEEKQNQNIAPWKFRNRKLREVGVGTLQWVDGVRSAARWGRTLELNEDGDDADQQPPSYASDDPNVDDATEMRISTHITPLTRKPSGRSKGRQSFGGETTPIERS
jgi:hypothetical protein